MQHPQKPLEGMFLDGDIVPETLLPILQRMMREQMPVLYDGAERLGLWNKDHSGEQIPRASGMHDFEIEGCKGSRMVSPYSQWMLQRAKGFYDGLRLEDRLEADRLLDKIQGDLFRKTEIEVPLKRENNRLCRA